MINSNTQVNSYKDLIVWQKSMELVVQIYELTNSYPKEERFGLISQIRRSAVSIPSNIAEGRHRGTRKDYTNFLRISYGSGAELETQIEISKRLNMVKNFDYSDIENLLTETMKMLNTMIKKLTENK